MISAIIRSQCGVMHLPSSTQTANICIYKYFSNFPQSTLIQNPLKLGFGNLTVKSAMAVGYGSLPTTSGPNIVRSRSQSPIATRRPWRELLSHPSSYSLPHSLGEMTSRLRRNLNHFRVNYAMIILLILFLSLLWHPISMIVFLVVLVGWWFLYLGRDEPIVVLNRMVDDRLVFLGLWIITIVCLVLTKVWLNVLVSILIGIGIVVLHATFRNTEDLFLDEEEAAGGGLVSVVDSTPTRARF